MYSYGYSDKDKNMYFKTNWVKLDNKQQNSNAIELFKSFRHRLIQDLQNSLSCKLPDVVFVAHDPALEKLVLKRMGFKNPVVEFEYTKGVSLKILFASRFQKNEHFVQCKSVLKNKTNISNRFEMLQKDGYLANYLGSLMLAGPKIKLFPTNVVTNIPFKVAFSELVNYSKDEIFMMQKIVCAL